MHSDSLAVALLNSGSIGLWSVGRYICNLVVANSAESASLLLKALEACSWSVEYCNVVFVLVSLLNGSHCGWINYLTYTNLKTGRLPFGGKR